MPRPLLRTSVTLGNHRVDMKLPSAVSDTVKPVVFLSDGDIDLPIYSVLGTGAAGEEATYSSPARGVSCWGRSDKQQSGARGVPYPIAVIVPPVMVHARRHTCFPW